jgi:hypothetical protein
MRSDLMPRIPQSVNDVEISGEWKKAWKLRTFLSHTYNALGVAIFTTTAMLKALGNSRSIYIDGTFKTAPKPYLQFITIHGKQHGHVIQLVFILATGLSLQTYSATCQGQSTTAYWKQL